MDNKKKTKKVKPKVKPKVIIVSSSSSSSKKKEVNRKLNVVSLKGKNKTLKKINAKKLLLIKTTASENEKIDLKKSEQERPKERMEGRLNERFIDILEKLSKIMLSRGEVHRARAYQKAQQTIMAFSDAIMNTDQLKGQPNIGPTIMTKLNEYVETGTLQLIEREKENPVNIFIEIYGVGPKKAKELVEKGITNLAQLREKQFEVLNDIQRVGLKYYEDILQRIPRSEIIEYDKIFNKILTNKDAKLEIVGSYRRGANSSGDIDVIITSTNRKFFEAFLDELLEKKIIVEVLSRGPTKCLVIAKLPGAQYARRVDFLYTSPEEYPFSLLYFTGSKIFNNVMRHQAQKMGYSMNEHGITKDKKKVDHVFKSEKDIFDFLNMVYKEPAERIDGSSVVTFAEVPVVEAQIQPEAYPIVTRPIVTRPIVTRPIVTRPIVTRPIPILVEPEKENEKENEEILKNENVVILPKTKTKTNKKRVSKKTDTKKIQLEVEDEMQVQDQGIEDESVIIDLINDFKNNGISILKNLSESQLTKMLNVSNNAYRNLSPIMTDNEYDIIEDYVTKKFPSNEATKKIGAPVEKNKVTLPYQMASMDKIKPDTGALDSWKQKYKGPYVLSCKLDGVSGLYTTEGKTPKLYTRGDGKVGQDVSHLIPYLRLPNDTNLVIRGEFIMPKAVFETKYKNSFANPRNLVSGIVNRITIDEKAKDLNYVAYEVIKPELNPSEQMNLLKTLNVDVVLNKTTNYLTNEMLSELLVDWRKNYIYEIDGVIVSDDKLYSRKSGNPDHSFAFKMVLSDQIAEAKVVDVLWNASKDGYLKPRVQIEPIHLGGVKIEYATGFNAAFIEQNKIGVGAMIQIIRSGDVIPHIKSVTTPAEKAKMPNVPYKWTDTHIDIKLEDISQDESVREKNITGFFRGIGVQGLSTGNVLRIIDAGYDSIPKIIKMTKDDFLKVDGFKEKTASKIHEGIKEKVAAASLLTIMSASNIFGRGISEKKIEPILEAVPDILTSNDSVEEKIKKIEDVKGMAKKSAELFVSNIPEFLQFINECNMQNKLALKPVIAKYDESHPLYKKNIVLTGFRNENITKLLKIVGANLGSSVSKNTFAVLVLDKDENTGKAMEARKLGIQLLTPEEFMEKYFKL